ncbi:hypothetical protein I6A84_40000 [Frankia sp. CNm7]|nr:hypothetical protein [Frankia nepalensis]MBL7513232.1 hypothetical protein [Frankia nepalensis]MBL7524063.1 hypothetical protein [Frankia nepalensis]
MYTSVTMPRLGESVAEGTVTRWLKQEGQRVEADEPLLEVSTDKVDTEVPSPATGILVSIKVAEDETVDVGIELAVIESSLPLHADNSGRGTRKKRHSKGKKRVVSVVMPRLGESVAEGTVTRWLKQEGQRVEVDEPLLEVSTDKVDTEVPSPATGILVSIKVAEDETVDVGIELAVIEY